MTPADEGAGGPQGTPGAGGPAGYRPVGEPFQVPPQSGRGPRTVYSSARLPRDAEAPVERDEGRAARWLLPGFRLALSLPLVCWAAVSGGLTLFLLGLLITHNAPELSVGLLSAAAGAAAAVCVLSLFAWAVALIESPRHRLWLWSLVASGLAAAGAGAALALGVSLLPAAGATGALVYAVLVSLVCGVTASYGAARPQAAAARGWLGWAWRAMVAVVATAAAAGVAAVAFSLFAVSFLPAQREFGLAPPLWSQASAHSGSKEALGWLAVAAANAGVAAVFGLCVFAAGRVLGFWRGRLHRWWLFAALGTVLLGLIAWLLDSSLPRW